MALYSKAEFATNCGMGTNGLAVYIRRGSVILNDSGLIDTANDKNRLFLEKRAGRTTEGDTIRHIRATGATVAGPEPAGGAEIESGDTSGIPPYSESERKLKFLDTIKREKEIDLLKLKKQKISGELLPAGLMQPTILQHNTNMMHAFKNAAERVVGEFAQRYAMTNEHRSEMRGRILEIVNEAMKRSTAVTISQLDAIVEDYARSRAQGERT